jgi:hypothetical protein
MKTLTGKIEYIGNSIIVHCYFTAGYIINPEYANSKEEANSILKEELTELVDELRTDLIHYEYNIKFSESPIVPFRVSHPNEDNKMPINTYMDDDGLVGQLLFGNSLFIESGDVSEGKEKLLLDIKEHVKEVYAYLIDDAYVMIEEECIDE